MLGKDFNDIMDSREKIGGIPASTCKCNMFQSRIDACNLMDIRANGYKFTWRVKITHDGTCVYERLDKIICNDTRRILFPDANLKVLTQVDFSDHHPILVTISRSLRNTSVKPFKFECA